MIRIRHVAVATTLLLSALGTVSGQTPSGIAGSAAAQAPAAPNTLPPSSTNQQPATGENAMPPYDPDRAHSKPDPSQSQPSAPAPTQAPPSPQPETGTPPAETQPQSQSQPQPQDLPSAPSPAQTSQQPGQMPPYNPDQDRSQPAAASAASLSRRDRFFHIGGAMPPYAPVSPVAFDLRYGSTYIPVDSWMYPALLRLYSLGYLDTAFLGLRPWTRFSVLHMLEETRAKLEADSDSGTDPGANQAREIYEAVHDELSPDAAFVGSERPHSELESVYSRFLYIAGTPLNDSYHLGQTLFNDYGRPFQEGFNNVTGFTSRAEAGRFSLYVRAEYQHAPGADGYSPALVSYLAAQDQVTNIPQDTIPAGPIAAQNPFRVVEANLSAHLASHEFSFGKSDEWMGPALGASMAYSNNAENIYSFRINRVEPLHIPLISRVLGPVRYDFLVGSLKGHTYPNAPWVHAEKFSFKPTKNLEIGFERTVIWGGKDRICGPRPPQSLIANCDEPITIHTFLKSFFSISDTTGSEKFSRNDPGARFSAFDFSYRLPYLRKWLTLYTDSETHDDVTPPSAPRRSAYRPGIYLSHFPGAPRLDLRVEGASTDVSTRISHQGIAQYYETVQRQGYTNKGFIFGDWIGREAKGGQAWLTYHLSGNELVQVSFLRKKNGKDFVGGSTQSQVRFDILKRITPNIEANLWVQYEKWAAPVYRNGSQSDTSTAFQVTWYPHLKH